MNWLNIETATLDSEAFIGSDPVARATWLCLFRYCAGQENGGIIAGCRSWSDRKWQQLARVTKDEVFAESALWSWEGDDLALWAYPAEKETEVQHRRERARTSGRLGGRPTTNQPPNPDKPTSVSNDKPTSVSNDKPTSVHFAKAEGEEKEKRKEGEGNHTSPSPDADGVSVVYDAYPRKVARKEALRAITTAAKSRPIGYLLERTKAYATATALWPQDEKRFIPHPATWFNRGSYDDDPQTWVRTNNPNGVVAVGTYDPGFEADGTPRF